MHVDTTLRRLLTWPRSLVAAPREPESASLARDELRQRCLTRLLHQGMPLWSDEPEHCDGCGRELLLGERAQLVYRGDELLLACPLCVGRLREEGYLAVSANAAMQTAEGETFSLAS